MMPEPINPELTPSHHGENRMQLRDEIDELLKRLEELRERFDLLAGDLHLEKGLPPSPYRICEVPAKRFISFFPPDTMIPVNIDWLLRHGLLPIRSELINVVETSIEVRKKYKNARHKLRECSGESPINFSEDWDHDAEIRRAEAAIRGLKGKPDPD